MRLLFFALCLHLTTTTVEGCDSNTPCFSPPIDVAKLVPHNMTINSTCGDLIEPFCVTDDTTTDCSLICDSSLNPDGSENENSHSGKMLVDPFETNTYWKSKNFDHPVYIQCDFGFELIIHQVTITFQFELPNSMYIQTSRDNGALFTTLIFFAIRCDESFGMAESPDYNGISVICTRIDPVATDKQISYAPRRDGYVDEEVLKGGVVRDYYVATNIKFVLHKFFTPSDFDQANADPRKFYFAIRDIDMQASCYCNGMSNQCQTNNYGTCICLKNTEGTHCERCKPLFNNRPWQFGLSCQSCDCNQHSSSCTYNDLKKYGVCEDCQHNTMGDKCEVCKPSFYRNSMVEINAINACISCNCHLPGVMYGSTVCHQITGKCYCKSNVEGRYCDTCKDGFYGLSHSIMNGCDTCACSSYGTVANTVCDKTSGVCECKTGFTGRTCSKCKPRYYAYPRFNPNECRECACDPSGSLNMTCDISGQCHCRNNYFGSQCEQIRTGYFSSSVEQLLYSAADAQVSSPTGKTHMYINMTDASGNTFYVLGYSLGLAGSSSSDPTMIVFDIDIPTVSMYEFFLQYQTLFTFTGATLQVEIQSQFFAYACTGGELISTQTPMTLSGNVPADQRTQSFGSLCLMEGRYRALLWFPPNSAGAASNSASIFILSLLVMPHYESQERYQHIGGTIQLLVQQYYKIAASRQVWAGQESVGAKYLAYSYGSIYDTAQTCGCNAFGTINPVVCNIYGGQCNCKENIYGRTCDNCLPQHYNFSSGLGCVPCDCDLQGSLNQQCDLQSGQCQCRVNVVGRTCNQCALQYYGVTSGKGCQPCNCESLYSTSSQCSETGQCECKIGVGGLTCERCASGYYDLSIAGCKECECDPVGTAGNKCNPTTGSCTCKPLVMGEKCDQCTVGYYGFSDHFPNTCLKCYCSGKTSECDAADDYYLTNVSTIFATTQNNVGVHGWTAIDGTGAVSGKMQWDWTPNYSLSRGNAKLTNSDSAEELYFVAPAKFLGNKRSLYMYQLTFDLSQQDTLDPMDMSLKGDVIIKGADVSFKLATTLPSHPPQTDLFKAYTVTFFEKNWKKNDLTGDTPSNVDMIRTLSNLEYIHIRAKWTKSLNRESRISNVVMIYSTYNVPSTVGLAPAMNVEYCNCPLAYTGQFCQDCNNGYTRSPINGNTLDVCIPCQCNQHSQRCDSNIGICIECQHNTQGEHCEKCISGFYGDATIGNVDDCKECSCPGGHNAPNQFADRCILDNDNKPTCISCDTGYTGRRCEYCSDGYYGDPMVATGTCKKCICNSNIDPTASGNCNTTTGQCLRCLFNTIGDSCQFCRPGFFGDALKQSCKECMCDLVGSHGNDCQRVTGHCSCKTNVVGRTCNQCAQNTYNFQSNNGCELCQCHLQGTQNQQCDVVTGRCVCNPRVIGDKCDRCAAGYYDLSKGCLPCDCHSEFTKKNTTCDALTGQCMCIESPQGGKYSGRTCRDCAINAIGTPPDCELCHTPCYDNWQGYIDQEVVDIRELDHNVTKLLAQFGSMSFEDVTMHLTWIDNNLTFAMDVFKQGVYNTSHKHEQFRQVTVSKEILAKFTEIENYIVDFEGILNQTESQLHHTKQYFETTVQNFDGTVSLSTSVSHPYPINKIKLRVKRQTYLVPTPVDAALVTQMANAYITQTGQNNVTGQAIYTQIENQYKQILSANESIADASEQLAAAMADLAQSATKRQQANDFFDEQYKTAFAANAFELRKIHDIVANVMILQNRSIDIHIKALDTLELAKQKMREADDWAQTHYTNAEASSQSVSQMKVDAVTLRASVEGQLTVATNLKRTADDVLYDARQEAASLADGVVAIATSRNNTLRAKQIAEDLSTMTLPVSLAEIQTLSNDIINTVVNEGVINQTYNEAQEGLKKAQDVKDRAQHAVDMSQTTLDDIKNLENSLSQSKALRNSTREVFVQNERKSRVIQNITSKIESEFSAISGQGAKTLNMLTQAIEDAKLNKMCFIEAKAVIDNATAIASTARTKANDAIALHSSNEQSLPNYENQINALYAETSATHLKVKQAGQSAQQLLHDVTEAERLRIEYMSQKSELELLKAETEAMEAELNDLMLKYETERLKFSSCNRP